MTQMHAVQAELQQGVDSISRRLASLSAAFEGMEGALLHRYVSRTANPFTLARTLVLSRARARAPEHEHEPEPDPEPER